VKASLSTEPRRTTDLYATLTGPLGYHLASRLSHTLTIACNLLRATFLTRYNSYAGIPHGQERGHYNGENARSQIEIWARVDILISGYLRRIRIEFVQNAAYANLRVRALGQMNAIHLMNVIQQHGKHVGKDLATTMRRTRRGKLETCRHYSSQITCGPYQDHTSRQLPTYSRNPSGKPCHPEIFESTR